MKVLLIGFGSIGKRHYEILNSIKTINEIHVVTKQNLENIVHFKNIEEVNNVQIYDYFIVASETAKHFQQLNYLNKHVNNKKILVEKPLFERTYNLDNSIKNRIFIAYNLRFHPLLQKLANITSNEEVYYVNVICGQYLPTWRPGRDYRVSYSAEIKRGGGVLRDLSHELDYIEWLFGKLQNLKTINTKISDLEINSDDIFTAIGTTDKNTIINISIDYISKSPLRRIIIHTKNRTIEADIIKNSISICDKECKTEYFDYKDLERNHTYRIMHEKIIHDSFDNICTYEEGLNIVRLIEQTKFIKV